MNFQQQVNGTYEYVQVAAFERGSLIIFSGRGRLGSPQHLSVVKNVPKAMQRSVIKVTLSLVLHKKRGAVAVTDSGTACSTVKLQLYSSNYIIYKITST